VDGGIDMKRNLLMAERKAAGRFPDSKGWPSLWCSSA